MKRAFICTIMTALLAACSTVKETGRSQLNLLSPSQEASLGMQAFTDIKGKGKINRDAQLNARVRRVGERIASVANVPGAQWEFVVFDDPEPNAFALPGGKVGVNTGIIPVAMTDAGLATVMAHEVAHVSARHSGERISNQMVISGIAAGTALSLGDADPKTRNVILTGLGLGSTVGYTLPHTRSQESEADRIGLIYMAKAGYDPEEAIRFWQRMREVAAKKGKPPEFLSTHPADDTRIANLQKYLPEAQIYYETARR
jgi:predicted Zn-dependent protease